MSQDDMFDGRMSCSLSENSLDFLRESSFTIRKSWDSLRNFDRKRVPLKRKERGDSGLQTFEMISDFKLKDSNVEVSDKSDDDLRLSYNIRSWERSLSKPCLSEKRQCDDHIIKEHKENSSEHLEGATKLNDVGRVKRNVCRSFLSGTSIYDRKALITNRFGKETSSRFGSYKTPVSKHYWGNTVRANENNNGPCMNNFGPPTLLDNKMNNTSRNSSEFNSIQSLNEEDDSLDDLSIKTLENYNSYSEDIDGDESFQDAIDFTKSLESICGEFAQDIISDQIENAVVETNAISESLTTLSEHIKPISDITDEILSKSNGYLGLIPNVVEGELTYSTVIILTPQSSEEQIGDLVQVPWKDIFPVYKSHLHYPYRELWWASIALINISREMVEDRSKFP